MILVWSSTAELVLNTEHVSKKGIKQKFKSFNHIKRGWSKCLCKETFQMLFCEC